MKKGSCDEYSTKNMPKGGNAPALLFDTVPMPGDYTNTVSTLSTSKIKGIKK